MLIINRQAKEAYDAEVVSLRQQQEAATADLDAREPVPIEVELLPEDAEPMEIGKLIVLPGMYYGPDERGGMIAIHPDDIGGPDDFWVGV